MPFSEFAEIIFHVAGWLLFFSLMIAFTYHAPGGENLIHEIFSPPYLLFYFAYLFTFYSNTRFLMPRLYFGNQHFLYITLLIVLLIAVYLLSPFDHLIRYNNPPGPPPGNGIRRGPRFDIISLLLFAMTWSLSSAIMKLSNIMRYLTDDATHDYVALQSEVQCISDYIELQRLRLNQKTEINLTVSGQLDEKRISSLILITFVENAFKYGVSNHEPSQLTIKISADERTITLFCQNRVFHTLSNIQREGMESVTPSTGCSYFTRIDIYSISQQINCFTPFNDCAAMKHNLKLCS
jgi:histidine kinase